MVTKDRSGRWRSVDPLNRLGVGLGLDVTTVQWEGRPQVPALSAIRDANSVAHHVRAHPLY